MLGNRFLFGQALMWLICFLMSWHKSLLGCANSLSVLFDLELAGSTCHLQKQFKGYHSCSFCLCVPASTMRNSTTLHDTSYQICHLDPTSTGGGCFCVCEAALGFGDEAGL